MNSNSRNPLISIITVTYNSEKYLERTIKSVISQSYNNIEYIIIDGRSTDKTIDIIKKYDNHIDYWVSESDDGIYHAMNKGIAKTNGDIIGIINSDDWLESSALNDVAELSSKIEEELFVIHGKIDTYDSEGSYVNTRKPKDILCYHLFSTPFKHPAMFVSKGVYDNLGVFNDKCGLAADYDLMLRINYSEIDTYFLNKTLTNVSLVGISTGGHAHATKKELFNIIKHNSGSWIAALIGITVRSINKNFIRLR